MRRRKSRRGMVQREGEEEAGNGEEE